jgi:hypothetical protein
MLFEATPILSVDVAAERHAMQVVGIGVHPRQMKLRRNET